MTDSPYTSADFHDVVQKQIAHAAFEALTDAKLEWALVAPFLEAARAICRADLRHASRVRLHATRAEGDATVEAEEAYIGLSVADRDEGQVWFAETWWLSDLATSEADPEQVRGIVAALERSVARLRIWLDEQEGPDPA